MTSLCPLNQPVHQPCLEQALRQQQSWMMIVSLICGGNIYHCLQAFLLFQYTVDDAVIQMELANRSVSEIDGTVEVCAEISSLPGPLQTDLTVTFSTSSSDGKAGLFVVLTLSAVFLNATVK